MRTNLTLCGKIIVNPLVKGAIIIADVVESPQLVEVLNVSTIQLHTRNLLNTLLHSIPRHGIHAVDEAA